MKDSTHSQSISTSILMLLLGLITLIIAITKGVVFEYSGIFSLFVWLWLIIYLLFVFKNKLPTNVPSWITGIISSWKLLLIATLFIFINLFVRFISFDKTTSLVNDSIDTTFADVTEQVEQSDQVVKLAEIVVPGESGTLSGPASYSYLGESARGAEAYLGDGGATATYIVSSPSSAMYELSVKLTDDGAHASDSRSITVTIGSKILNYNHVSEDTDGWKWFTLGNVNLEAGDNTITFTKDKATSAAYVMEEFKLSPSPN